MKHGASAPLDVLFDTLRRGPDGRYLLPPDAEASLDRAWTRLARAPTAHDGFKRVLKLVVALEKRLDAPAVAKRIVHILKNNSATRAVLEALKGTLGNHVPKGLAWLGRKAVKAAPRYGQVAPQGTSKIADYIDVGLQPPPGVTARARRSPPRTNAPTRRGGGMRRAFYVG